MATSGRPAARVIGLVALAATLLLVGCSWLPGSTNHVAGNLLAGKRPQRVTGVSHPARVTDLTLVC